MQHLECAALGIDVGSAHPEEHAAAGELGIKEGYLIFRQLAADQCADGPYAAARRDCRGSCPATPPVAPANPAAANAATVAPRLVASTRP